MPVAATFSDVAARVHTAVLRAPADPTPTPTATGFDWTQIRPDPEALPKSGMFYTLVNGLLYLGIIAALSGLAAGAIAFGVGPIFGASIISDRGKSMMWRAGLVAVIIGSPVAIVGWLLQQ
ncbi:hypothetical protein [Actinoplanes aureus]|uniref:Uncharacterized protein n=1 Tax=Actinoplanes aureus TaxID=2792083 RepID=A0A931CCG8_9ACTN|nr:hypothetical protein [Actinoplanes aureus]MBG0567534.1 hypothetical protein [Actinoplanes aureus]